LRGHPNFFPLKTKEKIHPITHSMTYGKRKILIKNRTFAIFFLRGCKIVNSALVCQICKKGPFGLKYLGLKKLFIFAQTNERGAKCFSLF